MEFVYVAVSSPDRPGWTDFFFLERDRDAVTAAQEKFPDLKNVKVQVSDMTRIR